MKLNNEQKVLLCQKALYAKQLASYANLCQAYKKLAAEIKNDALPNASKETLSEHVERYYGKFLSKAAQGDLSFIDQENGPIFNDTEKAAFHSFSEHSQRLEYFRDLSELLFDATHVKGKDGRVSFCIDEKKMDTYNLYLNPPKERLSEKENVFFDNTGRSFSKLIAQSPKRMVGHRYYKIAQNALKLIDEIDSNHIASLNTKNISLSPKSFGATITGARGRISPSREFSSPKQEFKSEIKNSYTDSEHSKYNRPISNMEKLGAGIYKVGYNAKENTKAVYKANKGTLKKAAIKAAKIGLALGMSVLLGLAVKAGIDAHTFNQLSAQTNPEQGYEVVVTQDTLNKLKGISLELDATENSSSIPSPQELNEHRNDLDEVLDLVVEDLVRQSFEEKYPNLAIKEVETHYDKSLADEADGRDGNYIYITCQDKYGKEYKYSITHFTSQGEDRIDTYFDDQYDLDYKIRDDIADSATGPHKARTEAVGKVLESFREYLQNAYELAGTDAVIDIPQAEYDNAKIDNKENIFQFLRAKFSILDPEFKLVIPEKTQTTETPAPIIDSAEHDDR